MYSLVFAVADSQSRMLPNLGLEHLRQPEPLVRRGMLHDRAAARTWLAQRSIPGIDVDYQQTVNDPAMTAAKLAALIPEFQEHPAAGVVIPRI